MSKIQEFIDAWNTKIDEYIAEDQTKINEYLSLRQTLITLTDPLLLKMPALKVLDVEGNITIDGFDVTTLGKLFEWTYPIDGFEPSLFPSGTRKSDVVKRYTDFSMTGFGKDAQTYTDGYTYGTMSYLANQYLTAIASHGSNIPLKTKMNSFERLDSLKKLKSIGGKVWFDNYMHSIYSVLFGVKLSVSKLTSHDFNSISEEIDQKLEKQYFAGFYTKGTYFDLGTKYYDAVIEAGDGFFPSQTSATQSGTQSGVNTDYILSVINPLSDIEKKVEGKIVFIESGNYIIPNSTLNGLPNPWTNPKTKVVVPNNTGTIRFNGDKSTGSKKSLADETIINLQNIIEGTYGLAIYLKYTEPDGPPVIPPSDAPVGSSASAITGASESSIPGPTASTIGTQEFTFNVEQLDIFSNTDFGNLFIIGQEDETLLYDDGVDTYNSEYTEDQFAGQDEVALEIKYESWPKPTQIPPDSNDNPQQPSDPVTPVKVNIPGDSWYAVAATFIASQEGFLSKAKWDVNHFRGGFGTSQKLVGSNLIEVTANTTFTKQEATDTLSYQLKVDYEKVMISSFGSGPWSKLNKNQKAAVVSLAYNCGAYIYTATGVKTRNYAKTVKQGVLDGNASVISKGIASGPTTGGGKVYTALVTRRAKESGLALA